MGQVYNMALRFKKKHPSTVGWRLKKNASIVEKHLNPGEKPLYVKEIQECNFTGSDTNSFFTKITRGISFS